jgi:hypothetical protein
MLIDRRVNRFVIVSFVSPPNERLQYLSSESTETALIAALHDNVIVDQNISISSFRQPLKQTTNKTGEPNDKQISEQQKQSSLL